MKISDIPRSDLTSALARDGIFLNTIPFTVQLKTNLPSVIEGISKLYADYPATFSDEFADFHIDISATSWFRRRIRPKVVFKHDGETPFMPLPIGQAFALFEWGLNWCVANNIHKYLTFHSAALEKNGYSIILPGVPGAGKSTLCAALACRGWRLLTDELTIISTNHGGAIPVPRPISLKNESIKIIKAFETSAVIGAVTPNTVKGTVALMKPPINAIKRGLETARPAWVVFPKYTKGAESSLTSISKCNAFMRLIEYSFNYHVLGERGFGAIGRLLEESEAYEFTYSSLEEAVVIFDELAETRSSIE
ncbi:MAG: HprK-related kinase A [Sedimenticola sp.]